MNIVLKNALANKRYKQVAAILAEDLSTYIFLKKTMYIICWHPIATSKILKIWYKMLKSGEL